MVEIGVSASKEARSDPQTTVFDGPFPQTQTVGTPLDQALNSALSSLLGNPNLLTLKTLGVDLGALLNPVLNLVRGILAPVVTALGGLLAPLLQALGVNLGGADLGVFTIQFMPDTGRPHLVI